MILINLKYDLENMRAKSQKTLINYHHLIVFGVSMAEMNLTEILLREVHVLLFICSFYCHSIF